MHATLIALGGRSAWKGEDLHGLSDCQHADRWRKGPFFVHFPKLRDAMEKNIPIKTQARACTILPNFVGYVSHFTERSAAAKRVLAWLAAVSWFTMARNLSRSQ